jgi:signal transduction histidine kinase
MTSARPSAWARLSIRARLMTIGILGLAGALVVGFAVLYAAVTASVEHTVDTQARTVARDVGLLVDSARLPDPVPQFGAQVVQILDADGRVAGGSLTADRLTPLVTSAERTRLAAGDVLTISGTRSAQTGQLRVAGYAAGPASARVLVVAAVPTTDMDTASEALRRLLFWAFPIFLGITALIAWRVIGAALKPVDTLRREADRIGAAGVGVNIARRPSPAIRDSAAPSQSVVSVAPPTSPEDERLTVPPSRDEISALAQTLNGMLDRLAAARVSQRAFIADAAHELRSPLASLRMQLDVAQHVGEGGSLPADLIPELDRLSTLVDDLLILARLGDSTPPAPTPVPIAPLLDGLKHRYAVARVPVHVTTPDGDLTAYGIPGDVLRAVTNLVDNAVRHAASAVTVTAAGAPTNPPRVEIIVSDDGHGIPESDRERVFERFTRLDDARTRDAGGSGLGLSIARELIRRSGGDIRLADAAPGLRAVVSLPTHPISG